MKQLCLFVLIILMLNLLLCSEEAALVEKLKLKIRHQHKQPSSELGHDYPEATSYYEGWVRYHHYDGEATGQRPKVFFQNNEFFSQRIPISQIRNADRYGLVIIPNKASFYTVLTQTRIQIFSSRSDTIRRLVDSLDIENISTIPEDAYLKGGVNDLGSFNIGNCFQVKAEIPNGLVGDGNKKKVTWVFCTEKDKDKQKLMKAIIKLKLQQQRALGSFVSTETLKEQQHKKNAADLMMTKANKPPEDDRDTSSVKSPTDGYWLLLQNWTECTLKCGGGESYQQWQCVEPKNGGKPCEGKAIRVRKCNIQPCPSASVLLSMTKAAQPEIAKPIIKVAPFSSRLQRYEKCVVKENDAFILKEDKTTKFGGKFPVRILMNNRTVTIYKDDTYHNVLHSYMLEKTQFSIPANKFCCFQLKDGMAANTLCGYEKFCGDQISNIWVMQWKKDFTLFKVACNVGTEETLLGPEDEKKLAEELKKKLGHARLDIIEEKQKSQRQQMMLAQNSPFTKSVQKTQQTGLSVIEKEMQLESLIKGEEKAREEIELNAIIKKIEEEKEKEACLRNNIKEREYDSEFLQEKREAEKEVITIKNEVAKSVQMKRGKLKKLIENMRAKARVKKAALEAELSALRNKMAQEMLRQTKNGDMDKCKKGKADINAREEFCDKSYIDDFVRNGECKTIENFCYMCCEFEYGNMHIDGREKCYNMCDLEEPPKPVPPKISIGPWKWSQSAPLSNK